MKTIAFLVNPVAASGKLTGRKTSDDMPPGSYSEETVRIGRLVLTSLASIRDVRILMPDTGNPELSISRENISLITRWRKPSSRDDTKLFVKKICNNDTDLLVFVGGDGTARDIMESCSHVTVIGVPSGIKMYSSIFALTWKDALVEADQYLMGNMKAEKKEIIDFNFELNSIETYGYLNGIKASEIGQDPKVVYGEQGEDAIAEEITNSMEKGVNYIIGPGTTCNAILEKLGCESANLLNFKIVKDGVLIKDPASEEDIYESMQSGNFRMILSPIGGMGVLIGRGNYEISSRVIEKMTPSNTMIIGAKEKISNLRDLLVIVPEGSQISLGDHIRVLTGIDEYAIRKIRVVLF